MTHLSRRSRPTFSSFRIQKFACCSNECFILALIYIDRLIQRNNFLLTELNVHRVVITAVLLAAKFFDDAYYNNAYYSKVGGVLVAEMNGLEVDFLFRINFSLHVTPELFDKYKAELLAHSMYATQQQQQHVPKVSPPLPPIEEPRVVAAPLPSLPHGQALAAPMPLVQHPGYHHQQQPNQVTPSVIPQITVTMDSYAHQALEQHAALILQEHQLMSTQNHHLIQRANSLPFPASSSSSGRCVYNSKPPYHSAPMVSMLPMGTTADEQYMLAVASRQLLPLQTTLVHHNHGVHHHHEHFAQPAGVPSYPLPGSLVAGRF